MNTTSFYVVFDGKGYVAFSSYEEANSYKVDPVVEWDNFLEDYVPVYNPGVVKEIKPGTATCRDGEVYLWGNYLGSVDNLPGVFYSYEDSISYRYCHKEF
jgi:hypothetical protein